MMLLNDAFHSSVRGMISDAASAGAAYLPGALSPEACLQLSGEARSDVFTTLTPREGRPVIEDMDIFKITLADDEMHPYAVRLGRELRAGVERALGEGRPWALNEASYHRYHAGSQALGAHKDFRSDRLFVAVFTISGTGVFELLHDDGSVDRSWDCSAGGLCLMRAPGLTGAQDDRPLHWALAPVSETREALIYREVVGDYLGQLV